MSFSPRPRLLLMIALGLALAVTLVVLTHDVLTARYPGHNDFVTPWEAARVFWLEGIPVYSDPSNMAIQTRIYGRPIEPGEFPNYYAYPFHAIFLVAPLTPLPFAWAAAAWMVALEAALLAALGLLLNLYGWKPRPLALALLALWMLAFYPSARGLILGQISHAVFLFQVVAVWAALRERDALAGIALAASTVKPQMTYLLVAYLLVWALAGRRWRLVAAFALGMAVLLGASFALQPSWLEGWLGELRRYTDYTVVGSPVWVLTQYYGGLGPAGEAAASLAVYALLLAGWALALRGGRQGDVLWGAMLTLATTHVVAPRTATTHFVVLVAPLLFYVARWSRSGRGASAALALAALLVLPWLHFVQTVSGEFEHPATYLPLPLGVLVLLWATRAMWRRDRVLTDRVGVPG